MSFFLQICNSVDRDFLAQIGNRVYEIKANATLTFEYDTKQPVSIGWERGDLVIGGIIGLVAKPPGGKIYIFERYVSSPMMQKYKATFTAFKSDEKYSLKANAKETFKILDQKEGDKLMQMIILHEKELEKNERRFKKLVAGYTYAELNREEKNEIIDKECVICMDKDANTFSQECTHVVLCWDCATALIAQNRKECPLCRVKIEHFCIKK